MINISSGHNTLLRLKELVLNLKYLDSAHKIGKIEIGEIKFATPLSITPVAAVINKMNLSYKYKGENLSYLRVIHFPEGISELNKISIQKTYLPIIHLHIGSTEKAQLSQQLNELHSRFLDLLRQNVIGDPEFIKLITDNTFGFLLGEMVDNIEEHAIADNMYLFAQYWPVINSCEVCIIDDGQGLSGSLRAAGRDIAGDHDALRKILETGLSAKIDYGDAIRGTGIKNTMAAITSKEINGEFFIMSGKSAYLHSADLGKKFISFDDYSWKGTIVVLKLNKPSSVFNLYDYVK